MNVSLFCCYSTTMSGTSTTTTTTTFPFASSSSSKPSQEIFGNLSTSTCSRKYSFVVKEPNLCPQPDDWKYLRYLGFQVEQIGDDKSTCRMIGMMEFDRPVRWMGLTKEHPELRKAYFGEVIGRNLSRKYYLSETKVSPSGKGTYKRIFGPVEWGKWERGCDTQQQDTHQEPEHQLPYSE